MPRQGASKRPTRRCWQHAAPGPSPFEEAAASESERRIEAALAELPLHYREVLLLVGVEGLELSEAAAVCGISNVALRQRLSRARAMLAHRLDGRAACRTYASVR